MKLKVRDKIFLDSGGLIALLVKDEEKHLLAKDVFERLDSERCEFFTTEHVLEELITWLRCRRKFPVLDIFRFLHNFYINDLKVIEAGRDYFGKGEILMYKYQDHFFSMTDCISFVVMDEFKIKQAFTTDKHFEIAGFKKLL